MTFIKSEMFLDFTHINLRTCNFNETFKNISRMLIYERR